MSIDWYQIFYNAVFILHTCKRILSSGVSQWAAFDEWKSGRTTGLRRAKELQCRLLSSEHTVIDKKFNESRREGEFYFLYLGFKFSVFRCMKYTVRYGCKKFFLTLLFTRL